jgi:diaminohydroxyphosphoribosylaminopyrimidine deaminase/5-amino-6-(5-phosphoribosylamino)uracil reductase
MELVALTEADSVFMRQAIELTKLGYGYANPNPLVGALIVRDGQVVAHGAHLLYGHEHAERNALNYAAEHHRDVKGCTMYVTLEPCSHFGHQPPCADAVVASGIRRVVVGSLDPNPKVDGRGIQKLIDAGIDVEILDGNIRKECEKLNASFFFFIQNGRPYIIHKYAMSLDGKIAPKTRKPAILSGQEAHRRVHVERSKVSAIITGIGTVLADDPRLTARIEGDARPPHQPLRVVVDSQLRIPLTSNLVIESAQDHLTLVATVCRDAEKISALESAGCEVLVLGSIHEVGSNHVDIGELVEILGKRGISSVMLECGGELAASFYERRLVNRAQIYCAPLFLGGNAPTPFDGQGFEGIQDAPRLVQGEVTQICSGTEGDDILIEGDITYVHRTH